MQQNKAKRKLKCGEAVLAVTINFAHAGLAEYLGHLGYDIVILDGEHGPLEEPGIEEFARACAAGGTVPLVRLPINNAAMQRYLAMGIMGFHIAQVRNAREAREVVDAVKFAPSGNRGLGTFRAHDFGLSLGNWGEYVSKANDETLIKVAIEEPEGLAALPEIAAIPEIDVIVLGTTDISASFGVPGQTQHPKVREAVEKAIPIIQASGKAWGVGSGSSAGEIDAAYARGSRYMLTSVSRVLRRGSDELLKAVKNAGAA